MQSYPSASSYLVTYGRDMIDYDSADPPSRQLAAILRRQIESGQIDGRLPGEKHLQQEYGLALATVRKAIKILRDEGLVRTVPGWGTFVAKSEPSAQ
jgi:DNA-binding GntR family transcriptional regulator